MANELQIQSELIKETKRIGGFGYKCSNRFLIGILDLSIQVPSTPHIFLEVKFSRGIRRDNTCLIGLTPHQRQFIKNTIKAGGRAGWVLIAQLGKRGSGNFIIMSGNDPNINYVDFSHPIIRNRGTPWPIMSILDNILTPHHTQ